MKMKRVITIIVVVVLVGAGVTAGVLYTKGFFGAGSQTASTTTYQVVGLTTGDLEKSVTGTGTLAAGGTVTETAPVDLEIAEVLVKAGQAVKAGDALAKVDTDTLGEQAAALQEQIDAIDVELAQLAVSESSAKALTTTVSGRVKQILCSVGDGAGDVTDQAGGLIMLSTDGRMKLNATLTGTVEIGVTVKVKTGGSTYTGLVEDIADDKKTCVVTLTDNGPKLGASATVYNTSGAKVGSGTLEVNRPYYVTATSGSVSKIYVSLNQKVDGRTSLVYLVGIPMAESYEEKTATRQELAESLAEITGLEKTATLTAGQDGTVQAVQAAAGQAVKAGDGLVTMLTGGATKLEVSVDELDINSISVGQTASIAIDAFTDKAFEGTVDSVSQIGSTSNGVTTYKVTIKMAEDSALKVGMNATATIVIEKHEGVLLLPLEALQSSRGQQYVWLYTGSLPEDSAQDPGTRTEVTTGMSNDNYVEITEGLSANDQVVVVRTKTASSGNNGQQGGMMFPGMEGGAMPGGGERPSGGNFPGGGGPGGN